MSSATEFRFAETISSIDPNIDGELVKRTATDLQERYSEPQRHYHTLEHIGFMLDAFTKCDTTNVPRDIIELAIWFHDCVYDPVRGGPWNEQESIRVWEQFAEATCSQAMLNLKEPVSCLIDATISHHIPAVLAPPLEVSHAATFLDLDMGILAASPTVYETYANGIRHEYAHYSDTDYRAGRTKVLQNFLARERIFLAEGSEALEASARGNIESEIRRLQG
ncbi:hypothetical protein HMN09_00551400 [Mycena chlorophos]|uniref:HD domain-containing protein n=1 Tax=Mycena chlorophos TaxID=658473 RepID=A0A8H6TBY7_MYCCL|nr:hypothetical protein HMN09_00551400 [Mycena chlorophos]